MTVKEVVKQNPTGLIGRAYRFAEKAHMGQKRGSGEPYFNHVLTTAETLCRWKLDEATVAAGLLHDVVEDTPVTHEELAGAFGEEVAFLVDGVTKLGRIKYRGDELKVENMRKMIFALSKDLRVVFIKLADRLHNMRTLSVLPSAKQRRVAMETDEIYAPLAYRLGMQEVSGELHDLAFHYLHPKEEAWIRSHVMDEYSAREAYLKKIKPALEAMFIKAGLRPAAIDFRAKRHYSLYRKLIRYDMDVSKIYDLVALRVIFPTVEDCYAALGVIHNYWPPLPGRIKDYVAMPKPNNYRSLHTTVIGPEEKDIEIQLRTPEMHEESEFGIAAHWLYKERMEGKSENEERTKEDRQGRRIASPLRWISQLRDWQKKYIHRETNPEEFLKSMKIDFFKDRIFAITPRGDVIDLPVGSTPIDFAYHIHSNIGDTCVGAKVNGQFAPLHHHLESGDVVEILTQKHKKPSPDWLAFVKTAIARDHIRTALRSKHGSLAGTMTPTKVELRIVVKDRIGLIKDITSVIARSHINIIGFNINHPPGSSYPMDKIECAITDKKKIEKLILKLKKIKEIKEVSYELLR